MKKLLFLLLLSIPAFGQGALFQLGSPPLPGAVIYVCGVPSTGNPCSNTVAIYSNQALTLTIPNPYTVNSTGSAAFWVTPGQYTIQIQAPYNIQYIASLGGGGGVSTPLWSNLLPPSGNLNLNLYQTVTSPFTTTYNAGDFGSSPVLSGITSYTDSAFNSTDNSFDFGINVPATSYHNAFEASVGANQILGVCSTGGGSTPIGFVMVGQFTPSLTCPLATQSPLSRLWAVVGTATHTAFTAYEGVGSYTGNLTQLFAKTPAGTGFNFLVTCAGANNTGGTCTTPIDTIRGDGQLIVPNAVISSLTPSTSPICPHGTGGALTTVGCASGAIPPGVGLVGATVSGTGTTSESFIPPVDVRWFFTNPFPTYAQAQSQDFGAVLNAALVAATPTGACVDVSGLNQLNAPNIAQYPVNSNIFAGLVSNTYVPCIIGGNFQLITSVTQASPGGAAVTHGGAPGGIGGTGMVIQPCNTTLNCTVGTTTVPAVQPPTGTGSCSDVGGLNCYATGLPSSPALTHYSTGTVLCSGLTCTGTGTSWTTGHSGNIQVGGTIDSSCPANTCTIGSTSGYVSGRIVAINTVSQTLTLATTWLGSTSSGQNYVVWNPNTFVAWCNGCLGNNLQKSYTGQELDNLTIDLNGTGGAGFYTKSSQEGTILNNPTCFLQVGSPTGATGGGTCLAWDQTVREASGSGETFLGHFSVYGGRIGMGSNTGGSSAFGVVIEGFSLMDGSVAASQANGPSVFELQADIGGGGGSKFQDGVYIDGITGMFLAGQHTESVLNDDFNVGPVNPVYNVGFYNITSSGTMGNAVVEFHTGTSGNQVTGVSRPSGGSLVVDDNLTSPIVATSVSGTPTSWTVTQYNQPGNSGYALVTGGNVLINGTISATNYVFNGAPYITGIIPVSAMSPSASGSSALGVSSDGNWYTSNNAGAISKLVNIPGSSDVTAQSASQGSTIVATAPAAGNYNLRYYVDVNTACTTGSNTVAFTLNWTDASLARTLTTSTLNMGTSTATTYLSGSVPIRVASGNVTYTSTVTGACGTGTSSYDAHISLTQ